ncbi:MAG: hypothetical protein M3Z85_00575 [Acidobacteriota bacterium]|nr:hypothetical protein [Acidobacteriota bacterium]
MDDTAFKKLNDQRLETLRILREHVERHGQLFDAWQASGHIADYRAWEFQKTRVIEADEDHQEARQAMVDTGLLPATHL